MLLSSTKASKTWYQERLPRRTLLFIDSAPDLARTVFPGTHYRTLVTFVRWKLMKVTTSRVFIIGTIIWPRVSIRKHPQSPLWTRKFYFQDCCRMSHFRILSKSYIQRVKGNPITLGDGVGDVQREGWKEGEGKRLIFGQETLRPEILCKSTCPPLCLPVEINS